MATAGRFKVVVHFFERASNSYVWIFGCERVQLLHANDVVPSFPPAAFRVEKCEPDGSALIRGDGYVHEVSLQRRSRGIGILEALPFVLGPMKAKSGRSLDTERIAFFYRAALPVVFPNFEATAVPALP
jgi:hypothetical protein